MNQLQRNRLMHAANACGEASEALQRFVKEDPTRTDLAALAARLEDDAMHLEMEVEAARA